MSNLALLGGPKQHEGDWPSWPSVTEAAVERVTAVARSGLWGLGGTAIEEFQQRWAEYCEAKHCVCVNCGTTAIELALRSLGVGAGDEVIMPAYTFIATATAALHAGAVPVFADIDADSFLLDPEAARSAVTDKTKAIIAAHIGGSPCDMDGIKEVAGEHGLFVIEDAAQAHGAIYRGRKVGALGHAGAFSFQSSKNLSGGEGGALVTNVSSLAETAWSLHNCGRTPPDAKVEQDHLGHNMRMSQFTAAVLLGGLEHLEEQSQRRGANAAYLDERLSEVLGVTPAALARGGERSAYHLYMMKYDERAFDGLSRDRFAEALRAEGIPIHGGYQPLYRTLATRRGSQAHECPLACKFYGRQMDYRQVELPVTEQVCAQALWMSQWVLLGTERDMDDIAEAMLKVRDNVGELRQVAAEDE
ncbi:MAG: DegT/DnrJ/EryC1/StrS family aminotransferase [Armatimonadota bacterium]